MAVDKFIRKISIGSGFPKNVMSFYVGQDLYRKLGRHSEDKAFLFTIEAIKQTAPTVFEIWVTNDSNETFLWKEVVDMPVVLEFEAYT